MIGMSIFCETELVEGVRFLRPGRTKEREFTALYENGKIVELWFSGFGRKTARVHESMIKEVVLYADLP